MIYTIPIDPTNPSIVQETTLDGTTYRFLFRWNDRDEHWYMSLRDLEDAEILSGRRLVPGSRLLRHAADYTVRPPGEIMMHGTPTRYTLGTEALLVYLDEDSVAEVLAG